MNHSRTRKILVVDDDAAIRYATSWTLREAGFAVIEADSGALAFQLVDDNPDLIILDVQLPDMSGFEVCRQIKHNPSSSSIPILHVSACFTTSTHKGLGLDLGADGYLIHPIEAPELIATVNALLRAKDKELEAIKAVKEWQTTFDAISDGICLADSLGHIKQVNLAMSLLLGSLQKDLVGRSFILEMQRCMDDTKELLRMLETTDERNRQHDRIYGFGRVFCVTERTTSSERDGESKVYCFTDVTERIAAESELKRAKEAAEEANRSKSDFLANMSHEIRTPLGAVLGFSELLKEPGLKHDERMVYIETITRNGRELGLLIDDILDLSKVEAGHIQVERLQMPLPSLLVDVMNSFSTKASEKGVVLKIKSIGPVPETIVSDPTRLRQILFNIVGNAIKFTSQGEVVLLVEYAKGEKPGTSQLSFSVIDTGRGIGIDDIPKLFKHFSQADASTTRQYGGSGLGLVLARKLAQALGGDVTLAASVLGTGSTFIVTTDAGPYAETVYTPDPKFDFVAPKALPADATEPLAGLHILVAEDALDNQVLIRRILTKRGAKVEIANNGAEAIEIAMSMDFNMVLMDIQMPIVDGYDAARELRRRGYQRPIIALTAHAMQGERKKCLDAGCDDHLAKPINQKNLVAVISQYGVRAE